MTGKQLFQFLRVIFFVFLSILIAYLYDLYTKDMLVSKLLTVWKLYQKQILAGAAIITYSAIVFYLGVKKGRKG